MNEWRIVCIHFARCTISRGQRRIIFGNLHWNGPLMAIGAHINRARLNTPPVYIAYVSVHLHHITGYFYVCNFPGVLISLPLYILPANPHIWIPRPYCREIHRGIHVIIIIILYCMLYVCNIYITCTNTDSNTKSIAFALLLLLYYYTICTHASGVG